MAKDGTMRGGYRAGAGRKSDKLMAGMMALEPVEPEDMLELPDPSELSGEDMPKIKDYMKAEQKSGVPLAAEDVFLEMWTWLKERNVDKYVPTQLLEQYAMAMARWMAVEDMLSHYGYLAKHPTTGQPIASPYVAMEQSYRKQVDQSWYQIASILKECDVDMSGPRSNPRDDTMEILLRMREK